MTKARRDFLISLLVLLIALWIAIASAGCIGPIPIVYDRPLPQPAWWECRKSDLSERLWRLDKELELLEEK